MATAAVAESNRGFIAHAVSEYQAIRAGEVRTCEASISVEGGRVELCGSPEDLAHWTICYVRYEDNAVLPLAVGEQTACFERFQAIDRSGLPYWDPRFYPAPVVVLDGVRRTFRPVRGRFVVGVAEAPGRTVLLVAAGESLAVVQLEGKATTVVYSGRPLTFSEVDVDSTLGWRRPPAPRPREPSPVRPSARVRAHHLRIAGAVEVDVGEGPTIDVVLSHALNALEWRARMVKLGQRRKRRGKTKLRPVLDAIREVIFAGGGIFEGGPGDLLAVLRGCCPHLDVDVEAFSNVLGLLHATGTCLVQRPTPRSWRLCLSSDLRDPRSELHRRFCEETVGLVREIVFGDGLTAANERAANERPRTGTRAVSTSAKAGKADAPTQDKAAARSQARHASARAGRLRASEAEQTRGSGGQGVSRTDGAGGINLDEVCWDPVRAARALCSLVMRIAARIEAEPDPLERARYEVAFITSMFKCFANDGRSGLDAAPSSVVEWASRLVTPCQRAGRLRRANRSPQAPRRAETPDGGPASTSSGQANLGVEEAPPAAAAEVATDRGTANVGQPEFHEEQCDVLGRVPGTTSDAPTAPPPPAPPAPAPVPAEPDGGAGDVVHSHEPPGTELHGTRQPVLDVPGLRSLFAVLAPILGRQPITENTCLLLSTVDALDIAQDPRGPPQP